MDSFAFLCILLFGAMSIHIYADEFNVLDYGATGNGNTDDSIAFVKAWNETCSATTGMPTMVIPKGKTFLVHTLTFTGPCKTSHISIMLSGEIVAPDNPNAWKEEDDKSKWLEFESVDGLQIDGSGTMNGSGKGWWDISCKLNPRKGCNKVAPTVFKFNKCNNLRMSNINFVNSPQTHVHTMGCNNVEFGFLSLQSPGTSPNTDGIHLYASSYVYIHNAHIGVGDDCISLGDKNLNVNITEVDCGPGHGVSIGSLGKDGSNVRVENITVTNINFKETTNGARIKTWRVGAGTVKHIVFSDMNFTEVKNPIIIDQHYWDNDSGEETIENGNGVHIDDVVYAKLFGTSKTEVAVNFNCSINSPCTNIKLDTIQLKSANAGQNVISSCSSATGISKGIQQPKSCLRS